MVLLLQTVEMRIELQVMMAAFDSDNQPKVTIDGWKVQNVNILVTDKVLLS